MVMTAESLIAWRIGDITHKAWILGWDSSLTYKPNPYKRAPQRRAFDRGLAAGKRATAEDVQILNRMLAQRK